MLNLFQHLRDGGTWTLKQVQGDEVVVLAQSVTTATNGVQRRKRERVPEFLARKAKATDVAARRLRDSSKNGLNQKPSTHALNASRPRLE